MVACTFLKVRLHGKGSRVNTGSKYKLGNILSPLLNSCLYKARRWRVAENGFHDVERLDDIIDAKVKAPTSSLR
jgi:hypothetical protein